MNDLSAQKLPKRINCLNELSYNLWWTWHQEARTLLKAIDRPLWKNTGHNPVKLLQQIPAYRLVAVSENPAFLKKYDAVINQFKSDMSETRTWVQEKYPVMENHAIAYFSMEFAFHNSLPIYAGGLGVLAGDYCKEASDLGLPLVCVGFMYPQGYFQQRISEEGWQEETYQQLNFNEAPIIPVLTGSKEKLKINVEMDSRKVAVSAWQVDVGRIKLYLLDTNLPENSPGDRELTARLYGGDREVRLQQEIVLGIGGVRMLRALDYTPSIWHANEGHAAFMMLERCRELIGNGLEFDSAAGRVRAATVFTTHTPVPAGNDAFPHDMVEKYLGNFQEDLGLDSEEFLRMGTPECGGQSFNMTVLGLRMAQYLNGVSELHGAVCRRMWNGLWPDVDEKDVPITSVTNGIHVPTWVAPQMSRLYDRYLGSHWIAAHDDPAVWENIEKIPDEELWVARLWLKNKLISAMQNRARKRWIDNDGSPKPVLAMGALLDSEVFTIGFSRRFTGYKRAYLILSDIERLKHIIRDELRPVQIVFSGKAHPNDEQGKRLIQDIYNIARNPEFGGRIAFVEDYDIRMAHYIVPGVDVWLNTPVQLLEASGTSGMKAAVNGVPHLSIMDGWWYEGYNGENGWAIGGDVPPSESREQDGTDADSLYHLLEEKLVPLYYDRDVNGIPHEWMKVVKQAIRSCSPLFSAKRMVKEYTRLMYEPAARVLEEPLSSGSAINIPRIN